MKHKDLIKTLKELIKFLNKNRRGKCKEINLDCPECKFMILKAWIEWWLDLEDDSKWELDKLK